MKHGERRVGQFICVDRRRSSAFRFGITAPKKYGNSPERNRFKRLVREAIRISFSTLPSSMSVNILPRQKAKHAKMGDIQKDLLRLIYAE